MFSKKEVKKMSEYINAPRKFNMIETESSRDNGKKLKIYKCRTHDENGQQLYPTMTDAQVDAYLTILHGTLDDRARLVLSFGEKCNYIKSGNVNYIRKNFSKWFYENGDQYQNVFISLNQFNGFMNKDYNEKSEKNLFSIDTLMFDIDAKGENLSGQEDYLMSLLFSDMIKDDLPLPNAFSYSGSGGVHIYYCIKTSHHSMAKAVKALKYILAKKLSSIIDDISQNTGMYYELDTSVFDNVRNDRLAGTMNPKTGRMCEFFATNVERYTFQELIGYAEIKEIDWDRMRKAAQKNYYYGKNTNSKIIVSEFKKSNKPVKKNGTGKTDSCTKYFRPVAEKRVNGIMALAKSGYGFRGCREKTCFVFRQMCRQAGFDSQKEIEMLRELNSYFYEPFDEYFLIKHTDSKKIYKYSNALLAQMMNIEPDSNEYKIVFGQYNSNFVIREYGFTPRELKTIERYSQISKIKNNNSKITIAAIKEITAYPIDSIKRICAVLSKNKSDIKVWAELDYTNEENYKFIKNYLSSHKLYSKNENAETPSESSDEKSCEKEILTVYKKIKRIPETAKKVVITNSDLVFKNIDSIYKVRNIISRWKELLKISKRITDRNSLHKNGTKFYGYCKPLYHSNSNCFKPVPEIYSKMYRQYREYLEGYKYQKSIYEKYSNCEIDRSY